MSQGESGQEQQKHALLTADGSKVIGYLPAGVVVWGGLGKLLDNWLDMNLFTPLGLILGFVLGMFMVVHYCVRQPTSTHESSAETAADSVEAKAVS